MPINIIVIDDDLAPVERLMRALKRADQANVLGEIRVDDSITKMDSIEKYDVKQHGVNFDVALIDYQLYSTFTGILVSAWIALHLGIPRLTLTSAPYPGDPEYFNGFIQKNEITDHPSDVIERIQHCIDEFNSREWLEKQHYLLVRKYQEMLKVSYSDTGSQPDLTIIKTLLDQFEKILDAQQELALKRQLEYIGSTHQFNDAERANSERLNELGRKLDGYLRELGKYE